MTFKCSIKNNMKFKQNSCTLFSRWTDISANWYLGCVETYYVLFSHENIFIWKIHIRFIWIELWMIFPWKLCMKIICGTFACVVDCLTFSKLDMSHRWSSIRPFSWICINISNSACVYKDRIIHVFSHKEWTLLYNTYL